MYIISDSEVCVRLKCHLVLSGSTWIPGLRPPHQVNQAYQLPLMECCFIGVCTNTNTWFCIRVVPFVCSCMRYRAFLSSLSNEPLCLYHCQITTCFTARNVFGTKSHLFQPLSGRVNLKSGMCTTMSRIF